MTAEAEELHVVVAERGEYSDHRQWNVRAFRLSSEAEWFAEKAQDWADEHSQEKVDPEYKMDVWDEDGLESPYDPEWEFGYYAASYRVEQLPWGL